MPQQQLRRYSKSLTDLCPLQEREWAAQEKATRAIEQPLPDKGAGVGFLAIQMPEPECEFCFIFLWDEAEDIKTRRFKWFWFSQDLGCSWQMAFDPSKGIPQLVLKIPDLSKFEEEERKSDEELFDLITSKSECSPLRSILA